jgi:hypothetical protein
MANLQFNNELAELLAERDALVFVHMDGDLKPLWQAIADSKVGGIDSLAPTPDNDTPVAQAIKMWPEKRLWVNFPSSVHLRGYDAVRAEAEAILKAGGHTGLRYAPTLGNDVPIDQRWLTGIGTRAAYSWRLTI